MRCVFKKKKTKLEIRIKLLIVVSKKKANERTDGERVVEFRFLSAGRLERFWSFRDRLERAARGVTVVRGLLLPVAVRQKC